MAYWAAVLRMDFFRAAKTELARREAWVAYQIPVQMVTNSGEREWGKRCTEGRMRDPNVKSVKSEDSRFCFSAELRRMGELTAKREPTLKSIVSATGGREYYLLLLLISVPFITPIPLPGFSIPFGVTAVLLGTQMAFRRKPWIPRRLLAIKVREVDLKIILSAATKIVQILECLVRPRIHWLAEGKAFRRVAGGLVAVSGLWLILPLPLPFSNSLPALTILLVCAAALERDGLCFLAGCATFIVAGCYFLAVFVGGAHLMDRWLGWLD